MPRFPVAVPAGRPLVLAHRGASARAPENTLEAFALARDLGADGVELDVRRTADGVLVVHHDAAGPAGLLAGLSFAAAREASPGLPTLAEALAECAGLLVNVEVKCCAWEPDADPDHEVVRGVADLVRDLGPAVVVSSFDLDHVDAAAALGLLTGWLTAGQAPGAAAAVAAARGHRWLHPDRAAVLADPGAVADAVAHGVLLDVWTVDDPGELRALADAGVAALITNVPDVARATLG